MRTSASGSSPQRLCGEDVLTANRSRRRGRDYATRAARQLSGPHVDSSAADSTASASGSTTRWGSCRGRAWTTRSLFAARAFRPQWLSKWIRETRPHWQFDMFTRQNGGGLESRYQDFHLPLTFQDSSNMEVGYQPERGGGPVAVHDQQRAWRSREPGPLRVQRILHLLEYEQRGTRLAQQPLLDRRVLRWIPPQLHARAVASA